MRHADGHAPACKHECERRGEVGSREGGREEPDKGDGNLNGGQELAGIARDLGSPLGALVTLLRLVLENDLLGSRESHLRHGEEPIDEREQERDDYG